MLQELLNLLVDPNPGTTFNPYIPGTDLIRIETEPRTTTARG